MAYRIYTKVNLADTSRDPDDIHLKDIGYKNELQDAIQIATDYIKENFFRKDTKLHKCEGTIAFMASDFCSYPETLIIEKIKID